MTPEERSEYNRQYREANKERLAEYQRKYSQEHSAEKVEKTRLWRLNHPDAVREYKATDATRRAWLKYRYGMSIEGYEALLEKQGGVCAICKEVSVRTRFHVDHDHETKEVRGLLCGPCNRALGLMKDDPDRLRAAATYLEKDKAARPEAPPPTVSNPDA